jgi:cytochrome P450
MASSVAVPGELFAQVLQPAHRANPYPLYARLREQPISLQADGAYVVITYQEIGQLLHDPRISSDLRKSSHPPQGGPEEPALIFQDAPRHTSLREAVMRQFTPQRIQELRATIEAIEHELLEAQRANGQFDLVQAFAYPLPVTVLCRLLGVPRSDEAQFSGWSAALVRMLDPTESLSDAEREQAEQAGIAITAYMRELIAERRREPQDDLILGLVRDGLLPEHDQPATLVLLLIAGHETTVSLITNAMLTLLRHPHASVLAGCGTIPRTRFPWSKRCCGSSPRSSSGCARPSRICPSPGPSSPRARRSRWCSRRAVAIRRGSWTRTGSIPIGAITSTWASAVATTTASERRWPGWRP